MSTNEFQITMPMDAFIWLAKMARLAMEAGDALEKEVVDYGYGHCPSTESLGADLADRLIAAVEEGRRIEALVAEDDGDDDDDNDR